MGADRIIQSQKAASFEEHRALKQESIWVGRQEIKTSTNPRPLSSFSFFHNKRTGRPILALLRRAEMHTLPHPALSRPKAALLPPQRRDPLLYLNLNQALPLPVSDRCHPRKSVLSLQRSSRVKPTGKGTSTDNLQEHLAKRLGLS
jgi:hypothetical protein